MAGCGTGSALLNPIGNVADGFGGAVADEPTAALVARDTLSAGGNAADAAVALYFALAATYPVAAGIGGGGVCVAYDARSNRTGTIDFSLARMARSAGAGAGIAPPGNARGMAALHARFGRLSWRQLVLPGERIARFGHRISRALARSIAANAQRLRRDERARALFFGRNGSPLGEGDRLEQIALATVLGQLRFNGAGTLHNGPLGRRYAESTAALGAPLPIAALRRATPEWRDPQRFAFADHEVSMVPASTAARLWQRLFVEGAYRRADEAKKAATIAEAALAAAGPSSGGSVSPDETGTTGFAVIDRAGGAVACWFSMGGPFGSATMLPGIGAFAPPPGPGAGIEGASIAVIVNAGSRDTILAAVASGGSASAAALVRVAGGVLVDGRPVAAALADRRVAAAPPRTLYAEAAIAEAAAASFRDRGFRIVTAAALGRVNAIHCADGSRRGHGTCRYGADPRGFGHAVNAER